MIDPPVEEDQAPACDDHRIMNNCRPANQVVIVAKKAHLEIGEPGLIGDKEIPGRNQLSA
jgi:hypothetical protein